MIVGRFLSADSIVPGAGNPQAFNRYAYTLNNPVKYTDPTGHAICDEDYNCWEHGYLVQGHGVRPVDRFAWPYVDRDALIQQNLSELFGGAVVVASIVFEPIDYVRTGIQCLTSGCTLGDVALTFAPGALGLLKGAGKVDNVLHAVENSEDIADSLSDAERAAVGSLPAEYVDQIQGVVDEADLPINVVGGYARGAPHPRKDIDYYIDVQYRKQWARELRGQLPGRELCRGRCYEANNTEFLWEIGWGNTPPGLHPPYIQFSPGQPPKWVQK